MNWVDVALIGTLAAGGLLGLWVGMVRASFIALGIIAGSLAVGQLRGDTASWLGGFVANGAVVDILSYAIIISGTVAVTVAAAGTARKLVYGMFMGWADRLAGMTAGLAVGAAVAGSMIVAIAVFSYSDNASDKGAIGRALDHTPIGAGDLPDLEDKLNHSTLVSILVSAADIIPDKAFDMLPEDWQDALNDLEQRLDATETARR